MITRLPESVSNVSGVMNSQRLGELGYEQIAPGAGLLACGDIGDGRMAEPEEIFSFIQRFFASAEDMKGVRVLVTARCV